MAKLALTAPKTLAVRPEKALAVKPAKTLELSTRQDSQLAKRADGTVVVQGGSREEREQPSRYPPQSADAHLGSNRLIRLGDAIAAGADPVKAGAKILSWGNKRVRQKLADGGHIDRRVGGSGWGGTGSGGSLPPGRGRGSAQGSTKGYGDTRTTDDRLREIRERDQAARKASGEANPKPMRLADAKKQLTLEDSKKPLALADSKKPLALADSKKPAAKPSGALGFAADAGGALKGKAKEIKSGLEDSTMQGQAIKAAKGALKDRFAEVKALWNGGRKDLAVKKALLTGWPTLELQDDAINWLEKRLSK